MMMAVQKRRNPAGPGSEGASLGGGMHTDHASAEPLLQRLEGLQKSGNGWRAKCPACGGAGRKLSITERDGRVLVNCFACNDADAVLAAVGLRWADLYPPRHWPLSREERERARLAMRDAGMASAVEVMALEVAILRVAAAQLERWQYLSAEDDARLALACVRVEAVANVLLERKRTPSELYSPPRRASVAHKAVALLRAELMTAERELADAERTLELFNAKGVNA